MATTWPSKSIVQLAPSRRTTMSCQAPVVMVNGDELRIPTGSKLVASRRALPSSLVNVQPGPAAPSHFSIRVCSPLVVLKLAQIETVKLFDPKSNNRMRGR